MITKQKGRTKMIIAAWAIAAHTNLPGTALVMCSAWTTESKINRGWHRHPNHHRARHRHNAGRLFSTAPPAAESTATYRDLFPPSDTISNGTLPTGENSVHKLYYEIHGTGPLTALFLHGGPGAGCFPNHARFFDPSKYTVVLLDQRGAGRSTPRGCVEDNTLDYLVEDCERLRHHLHNHSSNARPWDVVLGGSWGATLGLAYAQKHPSALRSLILRGICALRPSEIDWLFGSGGGSALRLPEAWKNFSDAVAVSEEGGNDDDDDGRETLHAYYDCLFNSGSNGTANNALRLAAARSWMMWEMAATASAAPNSNNNNNTNQSHASSSTVLVSSPERDGGKWHFENYRGEQIAGETHQSPEAVISQLRRDIESGSDKELRPIWGPRPVTPVEEDSSMPLLASIREASNASTDGNNTGRFRLPPDYVPAQAMLTCYYSVNERFVMGNSKLLEGSSSYVDDRNRSDFQTPIKIIGIQGGKDPICPPDTALDLLRSLQASTNNMELRIPLESGHSMYDPAIKHELVTATDRLAGDFLGQ